MTCMFWLPCALLDLLAVSVERLHDLVCAHKVTRKTTYCKSSKGESQALLVWVGVGWSCGELCKPFFCANFAPMPVYRLLNVADQLPLHIFRCNGVSGGRWDADRHTHTHTYTYRRSCLKLQSEASGSALQRSWGWKTQDKEKDRQRHWPSDWRLFSTNKGYVCFLDGQLQIRPLVLVSSYLFFEGSSAFVCMPFGAWYTCALRVCGSKLCNEKGKFYFHRPKFISNNLRYAGRKMTWACNTCVYMSLTCADTAALLLVPETLTCELCVLKITG